MILKIFMTMFVFSPVFCMEKEEDASFRKSVIVKNFSTEPIDVVYSVIPEKNLVLVKGIIQSKEFHRRILANKELAISLPQNLENLKSLRFERESGLFGKSTGDYAERVKQELKQRKGFIPVFKIQGQGGVMSFPDVAIGAEKSLGLPMKSKGNKMEKYASLNEFLKHQFPLFAQKLGNQSLRLDACMLIDSVDIIPIAKEATGNDIDQAKYQIMNELKEQLDQKSITSEIYDRATELVQKAYVAVKAKVLLDGYPSFWKDPLSKILYEGFAWKSRATMEKDFKEANNTFREYLLANCK